jgi:peptide deformylase
MILPVLAYGHPVLRRRATDFDLGDPDIPRIIGDMFDTMYASSGVGLAGPQVNIGKRIFVVDATPFAEDDKTLTDCRKVFINPEIIDRKGDMIVFEEGCLSFPGLRENVEREDSVTIRFYDENLVFRETEYSGIMSRIIQHEYDHIEGVVFIDRINRLRRTLLKRRLTDISTGNVEVEYKMNFPQARKGRR